MTRVLVVEDDAAIRALLTDLLEGEGFVVSEAACGAQAVRELDLTRPDAIVLDFNLPDMDGRQVAERCCQRFLDAPVPILLVSASPQLWYTAEHLRCFGVQDFVSKPFDLERLMHSLRRLTGARTGLSLAS